MEVPIERDKGDTERQRATDRYLEFAMQKGRENLEDMGPDRLRETMALASADRERELWKSGMLPGKQSLSERVVEGEPRRVVSLHANQGVTERRREVDEEDRIRGLKRLRGADQLINQGIRGPGGNYDEDNPVTEELQELVSQYKSALAELTFNSKPIITNLTIIAGENAHAAHGIATAICDHIISVSKEQKLPSLYLLDSIVKNIGGEYVKYFAARLPEVFCKAYRQVEPNLYTSMQHLFWTWRGVFPPGPLKIIEAELQFNPKPNGPPTSTQPTRAVDTSSVRPGHGIHVNPKYLEQRQLLQQSRTTRADAVATTESNGDANLRQVERPTRRESPKSWPDTQRPSMGQLSQRDRFVEPSYSKGSAFDFPDYDLERRGALRPDLGNVRNIERNNLGESGGWFRDGNAEKGNGGLDERPQRYARRNGYDSRQALASRSLGPDGQGYNRPPGPGRGGAFSVSQSMDLDTRGRGGEGLGLRMDGRGLGLEGAEIRGHRIGIVSEGGEGQGYRMDSRGLGPDGGGGKGHRMDGRGLAPEVGGVRGLRMDNRGLMQEGRGLGPDAHGFAPDGRGLGLDSRSLRPATLGSGAELQGLHLDRSAASEVRGSRGSWQNVEEEEYVWEDMKPQVREQDQRIGDEKVDERYAGDTDLGRPGSASSHGRGPGMDPAGGLDGWGRVGSAPPSEQFSASAVIRATLRRESEERSRLAMSHSGHGPQVKQETEMEGTGLGSHTVPGLLSTQARLPIQINVPNFSTLPSSSVSPRSGTPPIPSSSAGGSLQGGQGPYGIRQTFSSNPGLPSYNSLSPVTPAPVAPMSQLQAERQLPLGNLSLPHQAQSVPQQQSQEEQVSLAKSLRELTSSLPMSQVLPPAQLPMFSQSHQSTIGSSLNSQQPGNPPSGGLQPQYPQQTQSAVAAMQGQQPQVNQFQQPTQLATHLSNGKSDVLPLDTAAISELLKFVQQLPTSQNQIHSHQQPSQQPTQSHSQLQNVIPQSSLGLGQASHSHSGPPPLPTGPHPSFLPTSMYNQHMQVGSIGGQYSGAPGMLPPPVLYPLQHHSRPSQPPLPPGPRPQSAIAANSVPQAPPAPLAPPISQYDTLFKSLLAQGLISAPAPTAPTSASPAITGLQAGITGVNSNSSYFNQGTLQAVSTVQTFSFSSALVSSITPAEDNAATYTDAAATSSQLVVVKDDPIGTEFKPEILKERHEVVIDALYSDFPRQCKTCGLRFLEQEAHSKHMDWHVSRNRRQKSQKKVSRKWYVSDKEWLSGTGASTTEVAPSFFAAEVGAVVPKVEERENVAVPADYNQLVCALCGEPFDDFYSDEKDEWMYKGAVYMNVPPGGSVEGVDTAALGPIVHAKCQTESAATAELSDEGEEVQPELMAADSVRMEMDRGGDDTAMPLLDNFDSLESKEEGGELESRRKRVRY